MKAFLMFPEQDFDWQRPLLPHHQPLIQDLELNTLFQAMAQDDDYIFEVSKKAVLASTRDVDVIRYRQSILQDCLNNTAVVRAIYQIPIEAILNKRRGWMGIYTSYPSGILNSAVEMVQMFMELLKKLKQIANTHAGQFQSEGFARFFAMIQTELNDDYFSLVQDHLKALKFRDGVLLSATVGRGNEGTDYVLRQPNDNDQNWLERVFSPKAPVYSFRLHPRDDHGARAVADLKNRGINLVANALAQSSDHIDSFFKMLRAELAFYVGCLNLADQLKQMGAPTAFPVPVDSTERRHTYGGLYDLCLALTLKQNIIGNDGAADGKDLVMITGANQGGKSTFLRSIGLAQLMMQCGLFVPADSFRANVCEAIFTHFKREEDASMTSGKLDEELSRMSLIVDAITPHSMLLFNESFAATNEREGSEIGRQIISALLEKRIKIFFVTHLYELAHGFYRRGMANAFFLRAERQEDGERTFKVTRGSPLQTSFGIDLYNNIFGKDQASLANLSNLRET
ncbi:MAG: DNA mismatch repair protein MutS [Chloroflexi bacterium]|nr:DNA mismatch repair protein MutS [Chloroflexota bacterium]